MKKISTKKILKYIVLAYLLYLAYTLPKADWDKNIIVTKTHKDGKVVRFAPKKSSYIKYMCAWWENCMKNKGLSGIVDEYILAPIGVTFE